ncbi:hypothetical protein CEQ21_07965 (plasmid) [Niallia circulans]|uniref:Uncharacterized protein n=1 Tax=Niallia circulans TaxID=1397 RepID=A0A553SQM1_NIACI|nr:hypothetical protein [Niallia circulans]TRZ39295.1 hypothetical protein CEQ21_07965 [Niallia circulans]
MYLIIYKKKLNAEKGRFEFDSPQTFAKANEMLIESVSRYKQTGLSMKVGYKIIEAQSGESIFNSTISIDKDISSLYEIIRQNSNTPKTVTEYAIKVENREIIETENEFSFNNNVEEKAKLEQLRAEKNNIQQQLKKDEKERQQRELEHQKKMKEIQDEKEALEKSIALKEKEDAVKESQRIEAVRLLEEEKIKAHQRMEEKKELDRKKKEDHEKRLKQVEEDAKKAEIDLANTEVEFEKQELERKKELQALEEKKLESTRKANVLKAEKDKDDLEHQKELLSFTSSDPEIAVANEVLPSPSIVVPKLTLKERLQELDFEEAKRLLIQFIKFSVRSTISNSKKGYTIFKAYRVKQLDAKEAKKKATTKKLEIEEKIALEKIKFMEELKKDRDQQEKEIQKAVKLKEKEMNKQNRIEKRYVAAMKKSPIKKQFGLVGFLLKTAAFLVVLAAIIYIFHLGDTFPILKDIENYVDNLISSFKRS